MEKRKMPEEFLEKLILKGMMIDEYYAASVSSTFKPVYFEDKWVSMVYEFIVGHFKKYKKLPPKDVIINSFPDNKDKIINVFNEVESIDYDVAGNIDYLFDETDMYLKENAFKEALNEGVNLIEKGGNTLEFKGIMENALTKTLKIDLGVNYWNTINERLKRILSQKDVRTPSFYPMLDEFISGGFTPYTLSIFLSRIHGFKCVGKDTAIKIRQKSTNTIFYSRIENIWDSFTNKNEDALKENKMITLERMKEKYGEEEGERRYNNWKENISNSSKGRNTLKFFIKKYGEEEGERRYNLYIQRQKEAHSERGYIKKYGEEEGRKRYIEAMEKRYNKGFQKSEPETRLYNSIKEKISGVSVQKQVFIGDRYFVDIVVNDIYCIELFGDYWHCNPKIDESDYYRSIKEKKAKEIWKEDEERINFLKNLGYNVLVVWENDLNSDENKVIKKIKNFIKGI